MKEQIGEYIILQHNISKGAFGSIHKGAHIYTKQPVAIKELRVKNIHNLKPYVIRELEIHKRLSHPNIISLYDIIFNYDENIIYMILEFCELGDLQKFQNHKPFTEKYAQNYMLQLRDALKYLYDNKIIHRDLKPHNILMVNTFTIKITDFGLAREINNNNKNNNNNNNLFLDNDENKEDLFTTYCGSPMYMSPELLKKDNYGIKSDLWSVGVILYEMLTGYTPYQAKNYNQLLANIENPINLDIIKNNYSNLCYDLITKLLNKNKDFRCSWEDFFNHEWFKNNLIIDDENKFFEEPLNNCLLLPQQNIFRTKFGIKNNSLENIFNHNLSQNNYFENLIINQPTSNLKFNNNNNNNNNTNNTNNTNNNNNNNNTNNTNNTNVNNKNFDSCMENEYVYVNKPYIENINTNNHNNNTHNNNNTHTNNTTKLKQLPFDNIIHKNSTNSSTSLPNIFSSKNNKQHITSRFTFSLKSSQYSGNNSLSEKDNLLSDIDDDYFNIDNLQQNENDNNKTKTKPIDIVTKNIQPLKSSLNSIKQVSNSSSYSPESFKTAISNSVKLLKETYDYLSSNNNSI